MNAARRQVADVTYYLSRTEVARRLGHDGSRDAMINFVRRLEGRRLHPIHRGGRWMFRSSEVDALARSPEFALSARLTAGELEARIIEALEVDGATVPQVAKQMRLTLTTVTRVRDELRRLASEK